ncbi:hypothetical protein JOC76_003671 [Neobacillus cucumis]|nr:hypothetical protein [Neobacillus cucumis]
MFLVFLCRAVLKTFVDFGTMLIGAEGARLLENAIAFSSCVGGFEEEFQCPAGVRGRGDPTGAFSAEEAPRHARGFAERLERKSTSIFNTALRYPNVV